MSVSLQRSPSGSRTMNLFGNFTCVSMGGAKFSFCTEGWHYQGGVLPSFLQLVETLGATINIRTMGGLLL